MEVEEEKQDVNIPEVVVPEIPEESVEPEILTQTKSKSKPRAKASVKKAKTPVQEEEKEESPVRAESPVVVKEEPKPKSARK